MSQTPPTEIVFFVEIDPKGGFVASAINQSIVTQANNVEHLRTAIRDAVVCHFEEANRPKVIRLHFVRDEVIAA